MKKFLILLFMSSVCLGRAPTTTPLMPLPSSLESDKIISENQHRSPSLGLEIGTLGVPDNAYSEIIGLHLLFGGRVFFRMPFLERHWFFRPSLGYFRRNDGTFQQGVLQHLIEAGGVLQYVVFPENRLRPIVGAHAYLEVLMSQIYVFNTSQTSPSLWRGRFGPDVGFAFSVDSSFTLFSNFEGGFHSNQPIRPYGGFALGFSYLLD